MNYDLKEVLNYVQDQKEEANFVDWLLETRPEYLSEHDIEMLQSNRPEHEDAKFEVLSKASRLGERHIWASAYRVRELMLNLCEGTD